LLNPAAVLLFLAVMATVQMIALDDKGSAHQRKRAHDASPLLFAADVILRILQTDESTRTLRRNHRHLSQARLAVEQVLLCAETRRAIESLTATTSPNVLFHNAIVRESTVDALAQAHGAGDRARGVELRLVSDSPYALFETFEADEAEEDREDVRREMESRLIETTPRASSSLPDPTYE
jgi:hypothetical protein